MQIIHMLMRDFVNNTLLILILLLYMYITGEDWDVTAQLVMGRAKKKKLQVSMIITVPFSQYLYPFFIMLITRAMKGGFLQSHHFDFCFCFFNFRPKKPLCVTFTKTHENISDAHKAKKTNQISGQESLRLNGPLLSKNQFNSTQLNLNQLSSVQFNSIQLYST